MSTIKIPFNKPYLSGKELDYIKAAVSSGKISGDGTFTKKCHQFFEEKVGFQKALLTTSCTDALEMSALLLNIQEGDEVIAPAYTFVSTVNAFVLRGAKIIFADSNDDEPNLDVTTVESLITPKTKAIIPVHYAGVAVDMDALCDLGEKYNIAIIEDAAQAIDSFYKGKPLGSIGAMGAFSFHETKNIIAGEGGLLTINDAQYSARAEIIREKGTNRSQFFRGEVDKYGWVDVGSSFLPSDIIAAFLFAQLEQLDDIQGKRKQIWTQYDQSFQSLAAKGYFKTPVIPSYATNNAHMYYLVCNSLEERTALIQALKEKGILSVFHYLSLQKSPFFQAKHDGRALPNCDRFADCLLRLPLYYELNDTEQNRVIEAIYDFYTK
jgi:dTDP-4-amino-4,6-dideoxygalactose transaminase